MDLLEKQLLFMDSLCRFLEEAILQWGCHITIGEAFRTKEQAEIYAKSGKGIQDSLHCKRLAIDLNLFDHDGKYLTDTKDYAQLGELWESLNELNRWGGRFKRPDGNHFEMQDK